MSDTYTVSVILSATDQGLTSTLTTAQSALSTFQNKMTGIAKGLNSLGSSFQKTGALMTLGFTTPIVKGLKGAMKAYTTFEDGLVGVAKTTNFTKNEMDKFEDSIVNMSHKVPIPTKRLLKLSEMAGQLGVHGVDDLLKFVETMGRLEVSTNIAGEAGVKAVARLLNVMQGDGPSLLNQVDRFGAAVVELGNNFATSESELVHLATRMAPMAQTTGITTQEVLALSTVLSALGFRAQQGGSAMGRVLTQIDNDLQTSSVQVQKFADMAGMSADAFIEAWNGDNMVQDALLPLMMGLRKVAQEGGSLKGALEELNITGQYNQNVMMALAGRTDMVETALQMANKAWRENNALLEESNKAFSTMSAKFQLLKTKLQDVGRELISSLEGPITNAIDKLNAYLDAWFKVDEGVRASIYRMVAKYAGLLALAGPVSLLTGTILKMGGTVASVAGTVAGGIGSIISHFQNLASKGVSAFTTIADTMSNKLGGAMTGIEKVLNRGTQSFQRWAPQTTSILTSFGNKVSSVFGLASKATTTGVQLMNMGLKAVFPAAMIAAVIAGLGLIPEGIRDKLTEALNVAKEKGPEIINNLSMGISEKIPTLINNGMEIVIALLDAITANAPAIIVGGARIIASLAQGLSEHIPTLITKGIELVKSILMGLVQALPMLIRAGLQVILQLATGITQNVEKIVTSAGEIISSLVRGIAENLPEILLTGAKIVLQLILGIIQAIPAILRTGWDIVKALGTGILNGLKSIGGMIKDGFKNLIKGGTDAGKEQADEGVDAISGAMETLPGKLESPTKSAGDTIARNLRQGKDDAIDAITGLPDESGSIMNETNTRIESELWNTPEMMKQSSNQGVEEFMAEFNTLPEGVAGTANDTILSAQENFGSLDQILGGEASDATGALQEETSMWASIVGENSTLAGNAMGDGFESGTQRVRDTSSLTSSAVTGDASTMNAQTVTEYQTMSQRIADAMNVANHAVISNSQIMTQRAKDLATGLVQAFEGLGPNLSTAINTSLQNANARLQSGFRTMLSTTRTNVVKINSTLLTGLSKMGGSVGKVMSGVARKYGNSFQQLINLTSTSTNRINAQMTSFVNQINQRMLTGLQRMNNQTQTNMNRITNTFKTFSRNGNQVFTQLAQRLRSTTQSMWNSLVSTSNKGGNRMVSGLNSTRSRMVSTANSMKNQLISTMRSAYSGMYSAGSYAGAGFANGLAGQRGRIMNVAYGIANSVSATIRRALRIHSPSRVTTKLGEYTGIGYANGLENTQSKIKDTVLQIIATLTRIFTKAIKVFILKFDQLLKKVDEVVDRMNGAVNASSKLVKTTKSVNKELDKSSKYTSKTTKDVERQTREVEELAKKTQEGYAKIAKLKEEYNKLKHTNTQKIGMGTLNYNNALKQLKKLTTKVNGLDFKNTGEKISTYVSDAVMGANKELGKLDMSLSSLNTASKIRNSTNGMVSQNPVSITREKQPMEIRLALGNQEFAGFTDDVFNQRDKNVQLERYYGR